MGEFILSAFADEISPDLKTQMDELDRHGIKYIEIRGVNGKGIVNHSINEVKMIKKQLDEKGFKISAIGSPIGKINIKDDFAPHLDLFKHTIEIAGILETKNIRMFSFFIPQGENPADYRSEVMERWNSFVEAARGSDLYLLHENEKEIYGDTSQRCLDIIETMNSRYVKAIFDPANFIQCDVETYPEAYGLLDEYIVYMHIKDALYRDHSVVPSGMGDGKVKDILLRLKDREQDMFLSIEPHLGNFVGFKGLEPSSAINNIPDGGPRQFAVAVNALKKILDEIGG